MLMVPSEGVPRTASAPSSTGVHEYDIDFDDAERDGDDYYSSECEYDADEEHQQNVAADYEDKLNAEMWKRKRPVLFGQGLDLAR